MIKCKVVLPDNRVGPANINSNFSIRSIKESICELFPEIQPSLHYLSVVPKDEEQCMSNVVHDGCTIYIKKLVSMEVENETK